MGDRAWTNRRPRDFEELPLPLEDVLAEGPDHDLRGFHEAGARFLHGDPEAGILDARRPPPEPEEASAARQDVEQGDLLGDADRVVPRQHDHRGAEGDALRPAREVAQELSRGGRHGVAGEVVLEGEERIEPEWLSEITEG